MGKWSISKPPSSLILPHSYLIIGLGAILTSKFSLSTECQDLNPPSQNSKSDPPLEEDNEIKRTQQIYESLGKGSFDVLQMIQEEKLTMKKELQEASDQEILKLSGQAERNPQATEEMQQREEEIVKQGGLSFRKITVLEEGMIKNNMKIQIAVCDPDDPDLFRPMNKVLIFNRNGKYHATGSYCGHDFTDLENGILVGNQIICPTCGSAYNIETGIVEEGPSMRNISTFPISVRKKKVNLIVPDQIPAFALRETLNREFIDPRTMVIIGDSEAALSAIITLRHSFTGRIIVCPTSASGAFENKQIFSRKFGPLSKPEVYLVESDLFKNAQVDVISSPIRKIDHDTREITFANGEKVNFESVLFAGSAQKKTDFPYSNVYTVNDFETHAKVHNEAIKAKHICVLGGTFEAYQSAISLRTYLDELGLEDTRVTLFEKDTSEFVSTLGPAIAGRIIKEFKKKKISVIRGAKITKVEADHKLKSISFKYDGFAKEYFIQPDVCIEESTLAKLDHKYHKTIFFDKPKHRPVHDVNGTFNIDQWFSIMLHINYQGMYACGQNAQHRSFLANGTIRTPNTGFNVQSGFYAALMMLNKTTDFQYLSLERLQIGDKNMYFYGERNNMFDKVHIEGDLNSDKFICYYSRNGIVCGILTFGYTNLHLYMKQAMKHLLMPYCKILP